MPGVQKSRIPDHVIASIHQPTTSIPITKTSANPNLVFQQGWDRVNEKPTLSVKAYFQGYAPPSYTNFLQFIPGMTLEQIREGGVR